MFINITLPSDTQKGALRRAIRSQAALSSATCRKNTIAAKAGDSTSPEDQKPVRVRRRSRAKAVKDAPELIHSSSVSISSVSVSSTHASTSSSASPTQSNYVVSPQLAQFNFQYDSSLTFPYVDAWHAEIPQLVNTCSSRASESLRLSLTTLQT